MHVQEDARVQPLRVLVVDDEEAGREATAVALRSFGHTCDVASSADDALALHRVHPYDVIVSDLSMPGGDGDALCRQVRALGGRYVYFVLVTAHGDKEHMLSAMEAGADGFVVKPIDADELHARLLPARRIIALQSQLLEKSRAAKRDSKRLYVASRIDALTGLRNRRALEDDLPAIVNEAVRYKRPCSCAMLDIDQFKLCNDTFGHLVGDDVLRQVTQVIQSELRRSDVVYRYGGDELFIVLPEQTSGAAGAAMERVVRAVEKLALAQGAGANHPIITVSAGVAELRDDARDWIARADAALYRAKNAGRNRVVVDSEGTS